MRLLPLLFTVFMDSLGFGLVFPIFSPLIVNNEGGIFSDEVSLAVRGLVFGLLVSSFCLGQFFGGPILGALSDKRGRKKILLFTLWLALLGYLVTGMSIGVGSLFALFAGRILNGLASSNYSVAQSVVADLSSEKDKTKNFGLLGMAWGAGFIIGPFVGGKLAPLGYSVPFWVASIFSLINVALLQFGMKESLAVPKKERISFLEAVENVKKAFRTPTLRTLFLAMFIFSFGWGFFTEFSPVFLIKRLSFSLDQIANFYAWVGIWIALCQGLLIRPFVKRIPSRTLLSSALLGLALVLPILLWVEKPYGMFFSLPAIALFEAFISPTITTLVSNLSSKEAQGEMLGISNSLQWAAIALSPMFSGSFVALYPHLPVTVASGCMLVAFAVSLWFFKKRQQTKTSEETPEGS